MEDEGLLLLSEQAVVENPIAFGSNVPRRMFPLHTAPDRLGIEMGLRGAPNRGPTTYQSHPVSLFLHPLDMKPRSKIGWYFGGRTGLRSLLENKSGTPAPPDYQKIQVLHPFQCGRPFGKICPRFSSKEYQTISPGPGRYNHETNHNMEFHYSFGGRKNLKETARIKCTNGISEKCNGCSCIQIGDYYENRERDKILCPSCFHKLRTAKDPMRERKTNGFNKVRDCSSIHKHEFPGYSPKIIIRSEKETRRLKEKEAYLRSYFSD